MLELLIDEPNETRTYSLKLLLVKLSKPHAVTSPAIPNQVLAHRNRALQLSKVVVAAIRKAFVLLGSLKAFLCLNLNVSEVI